MAEWLAKNILGWKFEYNERPQWRCLGKRFNFGHDELTGVWDDKLCELIYSPNGFFAVWDAVIGRKIAHYFSWRIEENNDSDRCTLDTVGPTNSHDAYGDRYEAFYNAVYEAMNEKTTKSS